MNSCPRTRVVNRLLALRWSCGLIGIGLLHACGGGGGAAAGDAGASSPPSSAVVFSPASLSTSFVEGDEAWVEVTATVRTALSGTVVARIVDTVGVIQASAQITQLTPDAYQARFQLNPGLTVGAHDGELLLQLCKDVACTEQHPGSPWAWPYSVQVLSGTHLTPLQPLAGAADWTTFQGDMGHAGYAPMVLDATRFNRRWTWTPPLTAPKTALTNASTLQPVAVSQGQVFASTGSNYLRDRLYALRESDGGIAWQSADLTLLDGQANPPTVVGDRVLVSTSGSTEAALAAFDRASGAPLFKTAFSAQWSRYYAPVVVGQQVLNLGGFYGGLLGFDLTTGGPAWAKASYLGYEQSTPAADSSLAYALVSRSCNTCDDAGLGAIDPATGELAWRVAVPGIGYATDALNSAPVLADGVVYLYDDTFFSGVAARQLLAFSVSQRKVLWRSTGSYAASPVVGNGVVYSALVNPARIEARNAASGTLLWSWAAPTTPQVPAGQVPSPLAYAYQGCHACLVLAGNTLFTSAADQVHAIDLTRHTSVWTFPRRGDLSLSANGTLFVASTLGPGVGAWLAAINLR